LKRFKPEEQLKHAYFVYPHEEAVRAAGKSFVGSKRVFTSLLQTLLEKDKIGLGVLLARANSTPIHVLIVPQAEKTENDDPMGKQIEPPGFHLIQLAFADDLRAVNVDSSIPCATDDDGLSCLCPEMQADMRQKCPSATARSCR
jgi:ATP-dependent DNA helicase 2 subunit 1